MCSPLTKPLKVKSGAGVLPTPRDGGQRDGLGLPAGGERLVGAALL